MGAALGGEGVALPSSGVGYIDNAIPMTQMRLRFDAAYDDNRPDRAEFFYPKCGCFGPPGSPGPPLLEKRVDYQEFSLYLEAAMDNRFSAFIESPYRLINPEVNKDADGFSDVNFGFKAAAIACDDQYLTFQFRTWVPTGDGGRGLGTDHVSLEPALLYYKKLSDRLSVEAELRYWQPIGGTNFEGDIIRYGVGFWYTVLQTCNWRVAPVAELVGWTVLSGKELEFLTPTSSAVLDAAGDTIINAKLGARAWFGDHNSLYVGYGRALTGAVWYKDILRVEYRMSF
jgi:hypothetical protein